MTVNKENAKKSWESAGMNEVGKTAVNAWIDQLANNIKAGQGRWNAYARFATFDGHDIMGSLYLLKQAAELTNK